MKNRNIATVILIVGLLGISLYTRSSIWAQTITITSPTETTLAIPDLIATVDPSATIEYQWDNEDRILGPLNATELNTTYGESNVDPDTILLFHMNEGSLGYLSDQGSNGNNGTIMGTTVTWMLDGRFGNALWFTGDQPQPAPETIINTYIQVQVSDNPSMGFSNGFTYAAWIRPEKTDPLYHMKTFLWKGRVDNNMIIQYCTAMQAFRFAYTGGISYLVAYPDYPYGEWFHIAVTHDGGSSGSGTVRIYLNGSEVGSWAGASPLPSTTEPLWIGRSGKFDTANQTYEHFHGTIDDLHILNRALSAEEIPLLYARELPVGHHQVTVYAGSSGEVIVDNSDPGFSVIGRWGTASPPKITGQWGDDLRYHAGKGSGDEIAIWGAKLLNGPGTYEVSVWYPSFPMLATNAPFTINHNGVSDTVLIDQTINGREWFSLGSYYFAGSGDENVILSDSADSWVIADAVKFTVVTPLEITNVQNSNITDISAVITWDTNRLSDSVVKYGTTSGNYPDFIGKRSLVTSHKIVLGGLTPNTTYYYVVSNTDASGNYVEDETEYTFTTLEELSTVILRSVLLMHMDQGEGQGVTDSSDYGNDGTLGDTSAVEDRDPAWIKEGGPGSPLESSLGFDGIDDFVNIPDSQSLDLASGFIFSIYIKPEETSPELHMKPLLYKGQKENHILIQYCTQMKAFQFAFYDNEGIYQVYPAPYDFRYGEWQKIEVVYNGKAVKISVDDKEIYSESVTSQIQPNTAPLRIGGSDENYFKGAIDEVQILSGKEAIDVGGGGGGGGGTTARSVGSKAKSANGCFIGTADRR